MGALISVWDEKCLCTAWYTCQMNENKRKQGNIFDAESLGGMYISARASGRQSLICFCKYILCILIQWDYHRTDMCVWMKLAKECLRDQPDPAQSHSDLGKGTVWAQCSLTSTSQLEVRILLTFWGGPCAWGHACFFKDSLKIEEEEEKRGPVWIFCPMYQPALATSTTLSVPSLQSCIAPPCIF